jgi:predicted nucleic acid-binding protein
MAEASAAEYLVSGDKRGILALKRHANTNIITANEMLPLLGITKSGG